MNNYGITVHNIDTDKSVTVIVNAPNRAAAVERAYLQLVSEPIKETP